MGASMVTCHHPTFSHSTCLQAGLVSELDKLAATRGARVMQLAFYGNHSSVSISEQLHRASRCSLITGVVLMMG
eukprot:1160393-Pelagomonas_calceolata.AAC.15